MVAKGRQYVKVVGKRGEEKNITNTDGRLENSQWANCPS
jgi:hypothetical protein